MLAADLHCLALSATGAASHGRIGDDGRAVKPLQPADRPPVDPDQGGRGVRS
jgi:hypothetical protein